MKIIRLKRKGGIYHTGSNFQTDKGSWIGENSTNTIELNIFIK